MIKKTIFLKGVIIIIIGFSIFSFLKISKEIFNKKEETSIVKKDSIKQEEIKNISKESISKKIVLNDSIFIWDDKKFEWTSQKEPIKSKNSLPKESLKIDYNLKPFEIDWKILTEVHYKQKYFEELDMIAYAPIFHENLNFLHEKEVVVKGFVIPLEGVETPIALSSNPFSSCFFCGQASPASVISVYVKEKNKRYKTDDYKKFKGTLYLNYDDPNNFYYILRNAVEQ